MVTGAVVSGVTSSKSSAVLATTSRPAGTTPKLLNGGVSGNGVGVGVGGGEVGVVGGVVGGGVVGGGVVGGGVVGGGVVGGGVVGGGVVGGGVVGGGVVGGGAAGLIVPVVLATTGPQQLKGSA